MAESVNYRYWSGVCKRQAALTANTRTREALQEMATEFLAKAEVQEGRRSEPASGSEDSGRTPTRAQEPTARVVPTTLAEVQRRVAIGQQHVNHQETILADLERRGTDTTHAWRLLNILRGLQAEHVAQRERLLNVLSTGRRGLNPSVGSSR
jgi:hypothetical protein